MLSTTRGIAHLICWGHAELEQTWKYMGTQCCIICHPHRSIRKQIWPCHKHGQGQHRVIIWNKPQGMGIQPLGTSSGSNFVSCYYSHHFVQAPERSILPHYLIWYFVLFHTCILHIAPGQEETTNGDKLMEAERSYHFDHWLHISNNSSAMASDFMHIFYGFKHVHSPWEGEDNPLGPKCLCQQEGLINLVICCKFQKKSL